MSLSPKRTNQLKFNKGSIIYANDRYDKPQAYLGLIEALTLYLFILNVDDINIINIH